MKYLNLVFPNVGLQFGHSTKLRTLNNLAVDQLEYFLQQFWQICFRCLTISIYLSSDVLIQPPSFCLLWLLEYIRILKT